jgi:threonine aldolase
MASRLHGAVAGIDGIDVGPAPAVNSLFPILPADLIAPLQEWCFFWDWDLPRHQVRWMTAWDTTDDDVLAFAQGVRVGVTESTKALASKN